MNKLLTSLFFCAEELDFFSPPTQGNRHGHPERLLSNPVKTH
jgi:hypothetical protein